ncbi:J domain-containing protein required for chloroplast accumulation response 1-like isoform X2 [Juglans microcarpa x Juglans regia]|uniref:J domain-containing protein required for chloroplast accumulation response 1-like isoform X2 n=1 Tax=Juglans microcarpa x Juglans regia TaxID=2249226 RepID=UPI001B7E5D98|nr:J domain-containing protein required for chloroplast accumulation response 1-like isoform X2 [Juglans microcarpa x Juglans regia]
MERVSQRETVLLRYSSLRRSFTSSSSSPKAPCRELDLDFHDVFGGPPRQSSVQENRFSFNEAADFHGRRGDEDEALSCPVIGGKPVFGDKNEINRRRCLSNDFFDDIFRGDESLSPARALPPKADPFSLPAKLPKGMDLPVFGSTLHSSSKYKDGASNGISLSNSSTSTLSGFSSQAIQCQEELGNDVQSSYRQSPLSPKISRVSLESSDLNNSDKRDREGNGKNDSNSLEVQRESGQFHFSIYRWASKGVPLATLFRGNRSAKFERCSSSNGWQESGRMARESSTKSSKMECNQQENDSILDTRVLDMVEPCQSVSELSLPTPESETLSCLQNAVDDVPGNTILHEKREEIKPQSVSVIELGDNAKQVHKPAVKVKPSHSLFLDNKYERGNDGIGEKGDGKERTVISTKEPLVLVDASKNVKKQDGKRTTFQDSTMYSAEKLGRNKVKGRVKDFVKIFNQGASQKPKDNIDIDCGIQSSKGKKRDTYRVANEVRIGTPGSDENTPRAHADEYLKQSEKEDSAFKTANYVFSDTLSGQKDYSPSNASILNGSKAIIEDADESFRGNYIIKELPQGHNELPQSVDKDEEINVIDAKIRHWSNGKAGNIRSLLSTLQYVLWPESGWKPVALVDIIEGTSVKRAYQKALLCLHPDKLQQKGAASDKKYIAEKVFDILQEAWTHFNSLDAL